jgi:hypothetical protein
MSDKKVITIRFSQDNPSDMELYQLLEQEAGCSVSLASVAKAKIKEAYRFGKQRNGDADFREQVVMAVREELQNMEMKIIGAVVSCMAGTGAGMRIGLKAEESVLPEKSAEVPSKALDFLNH